MKLLTIEELPVLRRRNLMLRMKSVLEERVVVAPVMKIKPVTTFDIAKFNDIKAELIKRAEAKNG
jgi:hypothetical protein